MKANSNGFQSPIQQGVLSGTLLCGETLVLKYTNIQTNQCSLKNRKRTLKRSDALTFCSSRWGISLHLLRWSSKSCSHRKFQQRNPASSSTGETRIGFEHPIVPSLDSLASRHSVTLKDHRKFQQRNPASSSIENSNKEILHQQ